MMCIASLNNDSRFLLDINEPMVYIRTKYALNNKMYVFNTFYVSITLFLEIDSVANSIDPIINFNGLVQAAMVLSHIPNINSSVTSILCCPFPLARQ